MKEMGSESAMAPLSYERNVRMNLTLEPSSEASDGEVHNLDAARVASSFNCLSTLGLRPRVAAIAISVTHRVDGPHLDTREKVEDGSK